MQKQSADETDEKSPSEEVSEKVVASDEDKVEATVDDANLNAAAGIQTLTILFELFSIDFVRKVAIFLKKGCIVLQRIHPYLMIGHRFLLQA